MANNDDGSEQFAEAYQEQLKSIAQDLHKVSNEYDLIAERVINLIGSNLNIAQILNHPAYAKIIKNIQILYSEQYAAKRLAVLQDERVIDADDHFPISLIVNCDIHEFRDRYKSEEQGVKRLNLLVHERRLGTKAVYDHMRLPSTSFYSL